MRLDELCRGDFTQQLIGIAADAVVLDFHQLDLPLGVDDERAAVGYAFFLDHDAEAARKYTRRVCEHRVVDLADAFRSVVPGFVYEVGVGAYRVDLHAHGLEPVVLVDHVHQLGGAHEREVGRVFVRDRYEFAVVVGLNLEFGYR